MEQTICNECQTQNPAENAFCTACGHKLAPILVRDVGESLQEGYKLVAADRADQALAIASAVLRKSPSESGAYALMAMAHEQLGDLPQAIRCYEQVVRLRPESKIDEIKLAQLRQMSEAPAAAGIPPRRGLAVALSVGAGLLAIAVGMAFAWPRGDEEPKSNSADLVADNSAIGFDMPPRATTSATQESVPELGQVQPAQPTSQQPAPATSAQSGRSRNQVLPAAGPSARRPANPASGTPLEIQLTPEQIKRLDAGTKPSAEPRKPSPPSPGDENVIERRPGQINITESRNSNPTDPSVSENTYRIAQNKMKAGDYRAAVRDFQSALPGSDKKALIHQLIGRCYTRLGETSAAKQHFETALGMYEATGAKSAADSVRRELGLLG